MKLDQALNLIGLECMIKYAEKLGVQPGELAWCAISQDIAPYEFILL